MAEPVTKRSVAQWVKLLAIKYRDEDNETEKNEMVKVALKCGLDAWTDYTYTEFQEKVKTGNHGFCRWIGGKGEPAERSGTCIAKMRPLCLSYNPLT